MVDFLVGILLQPSASAEVDGLFREDMELRAVDALLRSGPPYELTVSEQSELDDSDRTLTAVAVDLVTGTYIGHASAHSRTTRPRGRHASIEAVLTHPHFEGRGVGLRVMIDLMQHVQERWIVRGFDLVSEVHREGAREMYRRLGFVQRGEDRFILRMGEGLWQPPERYQKGFFTRYLGHLDSAGSLEGNFHQQMGNICCGMPGAGFAKFSVIRPIAAYSYRTRS